VFGSRRNAQKYRKLLNIAQKYPPYLEVKEEERRKSWGKKRFRGLLDRFAKYLEKNAACRFSVH